MDNRSDFTHLRKEKRLLLISGDTRLVEISSMLYRRWGYISRGETTATGALSALSEFVPQVILLDIDVGEKNGLALLREIKQIDQNCNILLFTKNEEPEIVKEAWKAGAFFFLKRGADAVKIHKELERAYEDYFGRLEMKYLRAFVFVLMPFAKEFEDVYVLGIKEAVKEAEMFCERVDEQHFTEPILDMIFANIRKARFIVAEMSGRNPNVFYEIGYAHAIGKPVIFLARDTSDIPFDLKDRPHIIYGSSILTLKHRLSDRLKALAELRIGIE